MNRVAAPDTLNSSSSRLGFSASIGKNSQCWARWLIFGAGASVVQALDVGSTLSLAQAAHLDVALWRVLVDGYSSIAIIVLIYPLLRALCMAANPWDGRPLRMIGLHLAGFTA